MTAVALKLRVAKVAAFVGWWCLTFVILAIVLNMLVGVTVHFGSAAAGH